MVKDFYDLQGFEMIEEDPEGNREYVLDVDGYKNRNEVIQLEN